MGSMSSDTGLVKKDLASEMDEILERALQEKEIQVDSDSFESIFTINTKDFQKKEGEELAFSENQILD